MRSLLKSIIITATVALFVTSCDDGFGPQKQSAPVFESATVSSTTITFGQWVTLNVTLTEPATNLANLEYKFIAAGRNIASGLLFIGGARAEISEDVFVPLVSNMPTNTPITVELVATNVLKGSTSRIITGVTGNRPTYNRLYLVTEFGNVEVLTPQAGNISRYEATNLTLDVSFSYRIAEKVTAGNQIDYSGVVWGDVNGALAQIDFLGKPAFAAVPDPDADYTKAFVFDSNTFGVTLTGETFDGLGDDAISLADFAAPALINGELYRIQRYRELEKDKEYTLYGALADMQVIFNVDFFERTGSNKVKFLGETRQYTLSYNLLRQYVVLRVQDPVAPAFPDFLLLCGVGLGYPTKATGVAKAHTSWSFSDVRRFILMRKVAEDTFQATVFISNATSTSFKPYTDTGWGGDGPTTSQFQAFTFTGDDVLRGVTADTEFPNGRGDWGAKAHLDVQAYYRLTVNWVAKTAHVERVEL